MRRLLTLLGATAAGFTSVVALHGTPGKAGPLVRSAPTTTTTAPKPGAPTTTAPAGPGQATAIGPLENYSYGVMSVKVVIANHHIVDLRVEKLQTLDSYSQQLASYAVPILKAEVLKAQGIRINAVTGATYTSEAYAYSIQGALDKLRFK
ncbi:MAG: FMN-binding protein [Acidimicrobiales bacterium]